MIDGWDYDGEPKDVGIVTEVRNRTGVRAVTATLRLSRIVGKGQAELAAGADTAVAGVLKAAGLGPVFDAADTGGDDPERLIGGLLAETVSVDMKGLTSGAWNATATVRLSAICRAERDAIVGGRKLIGSAVEALTS